MKTNRNSTLEQIDKEIWGEPTFNSQLVKMCFALRKKPLKDFTVEDLRIMIGQNFNLEILIPIAIEKLEENILAEGNFYEGDLLNNVLSSDKNFWKEHQDVWMTIKNLYEANLSIFNSDNQYRQIKKSFDEFQNIN